MGKAEAGFRTPKFRLCAGRDACGDGPRDAGVTISWCEFESAVDGWVLGGEGLGLGVAAATPYRERVRRVVLRDQNGLLLPLLPNLRLPFLPLP